MATLDDHDSALPDNGLESHPESASQAEPRHPLMDLGFEEFAQRVSFACNLETGGKISPQAAYKNIKALYKRLKHSRLWEPE
jgi:hypothetical protein